ncbi:hypothetical protein FACS1894109_11540 [Spirochaetia bacterium]|nr:hypothetical protein FACS1894109_11540 [Spirochaetia bacterium]
MITYGNSTLVKTLPDGREIRIYSFPYQVNLGVREIEYQVACFREENIEGATLGRKFPIEDTEHLIQREDGYYDISPVGIAVLTNDMEDEISQCHDERYTNALPSEI